MFSSRLSNRSSFGSRIKKSEITERKFLNSSQYLQLCKSKEENPDQLIYDSLYSYEKQLKTLKGFLIISESKTNHLKKLNTFKEIKQFAKNLPNPSQPFTEQEQSIFKPIFKTQRRKQCEQLAEILQQKQQQQRKSQQQFLRSITEQYEEDKMKETIAVINLQRILNRKVTKKYQNIFTLLNKKSTTQKPNDKMIKNILTSSFMMVSIKIKLAKQMAFKTLLKQFGFGSIADQIDISLKAKGKALIALKQYPMLNLKRAFWRWHLSTTDQGQKLFKQASDKLVLYTNINKTTFFYRLFNQVRVKQIKVDPKVKRMTVMLCLYTKIFFERPMRAFFDKTKILTANSGKQVDIAEQIVTNSQLREKDVFKKWLNRSKEAKEQQKEKQVMMQNLAKKIVQVSKQKKLYLIQGWKKVAIEKIKQNKLKQQFLKKLLLTKTGRIAQAFNTWKMLPQKINLQAFKRISRFEKGLVNFAERTLKRALKSFKNEYEKGQADKKRAVIQLIEVTQGGQKKYYNKWKAEVMRHLLYKRCQILGKVFENTKSCLNRNFSLLLKVKTFNFKQVSILQNFFSDLNHKADQTMLDTFDKLKQNAEFNRANKWFYKAAESLALKSHITVHKSFWRLKNNAIGNMAVYEKEIFKTKLQKLCSNMKKHYDFVVFKAFFNIEKFIKLQNQKQDSLLTRNTNASQFTSIHSTLKEESIISNFAPNDTPSLKEEALLQATQKVSVNLCEYVFNENFKKQLKRWRYNVNPGKQFIESASLIQEQHPTLQVHIKQLKAAIHITQKLSTKRLLNESLGLRMIIQHIINAKSLKHQQEQDQNLQQRLQLITKQNALMQKIQEYKKQNESLLQQLQAKQAHLLESNKTVTILSLRINYMVMQKFFNLVEKVVDNNTWRSMNQGFDCIIEMANENFQRQQSNHVQEEDQNDYYENHN